MARVIGLDISLTGPGVAWVNGDPRRTRANGGLEGESAKIRVGEDRKGPRRLVEVTDAVMGWLGSRQLLTPGRLFVTEGYGFASQQASSLGEIGGCIRAEVYRAGGNLIVIPPSTLKKWATGNGHSVKGVMIKTVFKRWAHDSDDDNECDAWAAAMLGLVDAAVAVDAMTNLEREILAKKVERYAGKNQTDWLGGNPEGRLSRGPSRRAARRARERSALQRENGDRA